MAFFGEDLFGPAQSGVCGGEANGGKGEDNGVQDLVLRNTYAEELADVGADGSFRLRADGYAELYEAPLLFAQRSRFVLRGAQSVEGLLDHRVAVLELLIHIGQIVSHALYSRLPNVAPNATSYFSAQRTTIGFRA
jgi:hypothetical protein